MVSDDKEHVMEGDYSGKILHGKYSEELKSRVAECIEHFRAFDETGTMAIPYISAWKRKGKKIWYEFAGRRLSELLKCKRSDAADIFRDNIIDRRIYKYQELDSGIVKYVIDREELNDARKKLREETQDTGILEAVYKINLGKDSTVWLKDQATIERYEKEKIWLSLGFLTDVSKEMQVEEERERLVIELQDALSKVKTLSGLLPICSSCKKVRDDKGYWKEVEEYIRDHSEADFSHGICPECVEKEIEEFELL
jgi:hypothetical protein